MRQLQGSDASFVARETRNSPMHIGSVMIYDPSTAPGGSVDFEVLLRFIESRLQLSKTVRERLVKVPLDLDYPYWVEDENFDLKYHVRHSALPKPGNWHQLCTLAARLFSRPLDLSRPPWEFTMVTGLDDIPDIPPGSFAMVTKVHHAAIDGLSGVDLMEALHTLKPDTPPPMTRDPWRPEPVPPPAELVARYLINAISHPIKRAQVAVQAAPGLVRIVRGLLDKEFTFGEMVGPKTRFNAALSPHRVIEAKRLPLAAIKGIRKLAPGSWVNDVFLAIVGGALRHYLSDKHELPQKSLTSLVPVSVRTRQEKGSMGNQVAAMIVPIGSHLADPAERLRYVHDKTQNSKAMTNAMGARTMSDISKVSPALFLATGAQLNAGLGLTKQMSPPYSTLVTNVPGPRVPIYSAGARLHSMMGLMCLTEGMGLAHVVQTYVGEATISFTADRELMPDPRFYAECIQRSFDELVAASEAARPAKPVRDKRGEDKAAEQGATAPSAPEPPPAARRRKAADRAGSVTRAKPARRRPATGAASGARAAEPKPGEPEAAQPEVIAKPRRKAPATRTPPKVEASSQPQAKARAKPRTPPRKTRRGAQEPAGEA